MSNTGICLLAIILGTLALAGCNRESADWKSATAADTAEAYQQFLQQHPKSANAVLSFNLAILLEDMSREAEAAAAYRDALAHDPQLHDAHFNLSRLYERTQQPREALRHLLAYRRHVLQFGE